MSRHVDTGATDQTIVFWAFDASGDAVQVTTSDAVSYRRDNNGREGTPVSLTLVARTTPGQHRDSAITYKGDGKHEIDLPDAAVATAGEVTLQVTKPGVTSYYVEKLEVSAAVTGGLTPVQDETLTSIAQALAGSAPVEPTGATVFELLESINNRVSSISITTTGYAQLDAEGSLVLKRGHTATLTFTSTVSNKVSNLSASDTKVFFGIKDKSGRLWLQLEGTKLVNTGLQSVQFAIPKDKAAGLVAGVHDYDVVAIYGYNAGNYTSLEIFADGTVRVKELALDLSALG